MRRAAADENFNGDIVRVQDVGLAGEDDPQVLTWAAENNRIVLTHDRARMPDYARKRLASGEKMPGAFILPHQFPVAQRIREILLIIACTDQAEWNGRVVYLPL